MMVRGTPIELGYVLINSPSQMKRSLDLVVLRVSLIYRYTLGTN